MFRSWFNYSVAPRVAINIDSAMLRALSLSVDKPIPHVLAMAEVPFPVDVYDGTFICDPPVFSQYLQILKSSLGLTHPHVMLSLPNSTVITKVVQMAEGLSDQDIEDIIAFESQHYFSYPIEALYVDFNRLGSSKHHPNQVDVALVTAHKEYVDRWVASFHQAGFTLDIVDVDQCCFTRVFPFLLRSHDDSNDEINLLIDLGADGGFRFYAFLDKKMVFFHEEHGGKQLFAEQARLVDEVLVQLNRAMMFFSEHQQASIACLYLSGEGALMPCLAEDIEKQMKVTTYLANPFHRMTFSPKINKETLLNSSQAWVRACGLGLRHD